MPQRRNRPYKGLTLQQLQSLCETGRLGSFLAAAGALGVSHPTVWKQVHALEREFGLSLVETHRSGCRLTEAGRLLIEMASPAVESMATLRNRFRERFEQAGTHLTIAVTPRLVAEELATCVAEFRSRFPETRFRFLETSEEGVIDAVESRQADFGFSPTLLTEKQQRMLLAEASYSSEAFLIAPQDHPLALRRSVHPRDLRAYPLVNSPFAYPSSNVRAVLQRYQVFQTDYLVQVDYTASIRRLVELRCGIGLIYAVPSVKRSSNLHERSMSRYFDDVSIRVIRRRGGFSAASAEAFVSFVRNQLRKPGR